MISYLEQLKEKASKHGVFLHKAFQAAKINQTTYARSMKSRTSLRWKTTLAVSAAIDVMVAERKKPTPVESRRKTSRLRLVKD